jgi:DNA repair photolyase
MKPIGRSQLWKKHLGDWGVNVYNGCEFGCLACYSPAQPGVAAQPYWAGKSQADWGRHFAARDGLVDALRQQLRTFTPDRALKTDWGQGRVLVSFLCDAYQPMEEKLGVPFHSPAPARGQTTPGFVLGSDRRGGPVRRGRAPVVQPPR